MKNELRSKKLLERLQHDPIKKKKKDNRIIKKITDLPEWKSARKILLYLPIHGEVDLQKLFQLKKPKKQYILPRVNGKKLDLHYILDLAQVKKGKFNIIEPQKKLKKTIPADIDLAFIPGVVFSDNGHRIGYGKGFFDRLLKKTRCLKIGIAYDFQIVKNIQGHEHDVAMDLIITEKRTIKPKWSVAESRKRLL